MSRRIVDCGRAEVKGALVRFKQKGTLEAFDRNFAELERVFVRSTPAPDIRLFADFVFPGDVFRVWQDSTLVNYKEFLSKVELAGLENFRSMVGYVTQAAPDRLDATSRAFADKSGAPDRFVNKDELADYDRALARGDATFAERRPVPAAARVAPERGKQAAVEAAWKELAPQLAEQEKAERGGQNVAPIAGAVLIALGVATATLVVLAFRGTMRWQQAHPDESTGSSMAVFAGGGVLALGFLLVGMLYLYRASKAARKDDA
jgi:hypothetical protein